MVTMEGHNLSIYPMLSDRTEEILEATIRDFIAYGEPVSSSQLYARHGFGIRPAMIRWELNHLTDAGYLEQPYHSAGRVPSDMGYEFYANGFLDGLEQAARARQQVVLGQKLHHLLHRRAWGDMLHSMSASLGALSVLFDTHAGLLYKEGLDNLVDNLDWDTREQICQVIHDFESIDERVEGQQKNSAPEDRTVGVYVGKKSPFTKSEDLSVIVARIPHPNLKDDDLTVLVVGPKRMDYERAIQLLQQLQEGIQT